MRREETKVVQIGNCKIGGGNPVAIQSMTNTKTEDVEATVAQILALEAAGCDIIRCAVPTMEAAEALTEIKKRIHIPLVADIHFDYRLAIAAIEHGADKIRINPGNIGDVSRVREVVEKAKEYNVPIRVGVNSGSLEKHLVEKYGGVTAEGIVESALEAVPAEFVHRGRTPDDDIHMAQDQVYASNFGEGIFTHDLETGERRSTVKQDAVDILRVVDSLDNIHIYNRAIGPQDVPSESASMHNAEVAFCYTSKPMHLVSGSPFQTKKMIKMAEIAAGGKEELKRRPRTAFNHTTISPLRISHEACENAMIVAEAGLPNHILVMVQQGATSPISYAGSVAVHNADFLAFNTLLQCVNRGNPTLYGASACVMDMKKGLSLVAAPEVFVLNAAMARMSKYYNIPSYIAGG